MIYTTIFGTLLWLTAALLPSKGFETDEAQPSQTAQQQKLQGAWELVSGVMPYADIPAGATAVALLQDGYFSVAYFRPDRPAFIGTYGGTYTLNAGKITQHLMYNTFDSASVGSTRTLGYTLRDG